MTHERPILRAGNVRAPRHDAQYRAIMSSLVEGLADTEMVAEYAAGLDAEGVTPLVERIKAALSQLE